MLRERETRGGRERAPHLNEGRNAVVRAAIGPLGPGLDQAAVRGHAHSHLQALARGGLDKVRLLLKLVVGEGARHEHGARHALQRALHVSVHHEVAREERHVRQRRKSRGARVVQLAPAGVGRARAKSVL